MISRLIGSFVVPLLILPTLMIFVFLAISTSAAEVPPAEYTCAGKAALLSRQEPGETFMAKLKIEELTFCSHKNVFERSLTEAPAKGFTYEVMFKPLEGAKFKKRDRLFFKVTWHCRETKCSPKAWVQVSEADTKASPR